MIAVAAPAFGVADLYDRFEDAEQVELARACLTEVAANEAAYGKLARVGDLGGYRVAALGFEEKQLVAMSWLYSERVVRDGRAGRQAYNTLRNRPKARRCPVCCLAEARTLDHFLPRSLYRDLSVTPVNLVPLCERCNTAKRDSDLVPGEAQPIHPYFDDLSGIDWLGARVDANSQQPVTFFVNRGLDRADESLALRIEATFERYFLESIYTSSAINELSGMIDLFDNLRRVGGEVGLRAHLLDVASSCRKDPLSRWKSASYAAWAESEEFCAGDYWNGYSINSAAPDPNVTVEVGDRITTVDYGLGVVTRIEGAEADRALHVDFEGGSSRILLTKLSAFTVI